MTRTYAEDRQPDRRGSKDAAPATGRYYRPELDMVRLVAFLLVYLLHNLPNTTDPRVIHLFGALAPVVLASVGACKFGLSLFFTLSAFLICELLLREREFAGTVAVKQFYIRRLLRIWPLYYFALLLGVAFALAPGAQPGVIAKIGWFALFLGAWHSSLFGWIRSPISPLWSVSVEEQFYLFAPWAVKFFSRKALYWFCAALILLSNLWLYYLGATHATGHRVWADSFVQFQCFAAGILLSLTLRGRIPRFALWQRLTAIVGCWLCWTADSGWLSASFERAADNPGSWALMGSYALASLGSVLLLIAFLGINPNWIPRWAIYLGRISFGLYVYHEFAMKKLSANLPLDQLDLHAIPFYPLRAVLTVVITLGVPLSLTLLMAMLSYRFLETPFLKLKRRHAVIETQPIAGVEVD